MSININRPIITYENVGVFQSSVPAHNAESNSGENISFLPLVQGIDFSIDIDRASISAIGTKGFVNRSLKRSPDIDLKINSIETFDGLFSGLFVSGKTSIRENLDIDRNFYAVIGSKRGFDVSGENLSGKDLLSFGNCFLDNVSISQSVNGLINSEYSYICSNLEAQEINFDFSFRCPSINLSGDQSQHISGVFSEMSSYYNNDSSKIIPSYSTNVIISGDSSDGNFLIKLDSIQSFNLNLPIERKSIYTLGKKYPLTRKVLFPNEGSFSLSNKISNFETSSGNANLKDFLNSDENYTIIISGKDLSNKGFHFKMSNAKLMSQSYGSSISSDIVADLNFSFELNKLSAPGFIDKIMAQDGSFILTEDGGYIEIN